MRKTNFEDVGDFHHKFGLHSVSHDGAGPTAVTEDLMAFRSNFLQEELDEFNKGVAEQDIAQMADALVDLVYVALGTAHLLGLPWQDLWDDVQRANITKQRAAADGSDSKRGSSFDVVKPAGWVGPNTLAVLLDYDFSNSLACPGCGSLFAEPATTCILSWSREAGKQFGRVYCGTTAAWL